MWNIHACTICTTSKRWRECSIITPYSLGYTMCSVLGYVYNKCLGKLFFMYYNGTSRMLLYSILIFDGFLCVESSQSRVRTFSNDSMDDDSILSYSDKITISWRHTVKVFSLSLSIYHNLSSLSDLSQLSYSDKSTIS